jgi:hypothetical protein
MSTLKSITVTVSDGKTDHTFEVDIDKNCLLVWGTAGWAVLADHYKLVKQDAAKEKAVRERTCPKATPKATLKDGALGAKLVGPAPSGEAVIAMKTPDCLPSTWP